MNYHESRANTAEKRYIKARAGHRKSKLLGEKVYKWRHAALRAWHKRQMELKL